METAFEKARKVLAGRGMAGAASLFTMAMEGRNREWMASGSKADEKAYRYCCACFVALARLAAKERAASKAPRGWVAV